MSGTAAERILSENDLQQHWVRRIIAIAIDSIVVAIATAVLGLVTDISGIFNWMSLPFVMGLIYVLYFTVAESIYGYTMGKKLVNLKVTLASGKRPSLKNAFIRNISKIYWILLLLDLVGGLITSTDLHQKYSDRVANTTVISDKYTAV